MDERIFVTIDKSDYLEHHGIKGQRWGIRRFQNKNGTWTSLGKKMRRAKETRTAEAEKRKKLKLIRAENKKKLERAQAISGGDPRLIEKYMNTMSDKELQQAIQRASARSNVRRLDKESGAFNTGTQALRDILSTAGSVVAIGTTAVLAYDTYDKLSKRANALGVKMPAVKSFDTGKKKK